jgi:myosin heavy subunit
MGEASLGDVDDMAELSDLTLGSIMRNCAVRFARNNIYVCTIMSSCRH